MKKFYSIRDISSFNAQKGKNFFAPSTMKFFSSRISERVHPGGVFVTSEKTGSNPRKYTVRQIDQETGKISTIGEFREHASSASAHNAAKSYAESQGYTW